MKEADAGDSTVISAVNLFSHFKATFLDVVDLGTKRI
jgi:hypothetical protein